MDNTVGDHGSPRLRPEVTLIPAEREVDGCEASIAAHNLVDTGVFLAQEGASRADRTQYLNYTVPQNQKGQQMQQQSASRRATTLCPPPHLPPRELATTYTAMQPTPSTSAAYPRTNARVSLRVGKRGPGRARGSASRVPTDRTAVRLADERTEQRECQ